MTFPFSSKRLLNTLQSLPDATRYCVAYSGGLDSHVLLHALSALRGDISAGLRAIHVNHNVSNNAELWVTHAKSICEELKVDLHVVNVDAGSPHGKSPEAWARQLRYQALRDTIRAGDIIFTAHQKDDQAETILLQLIRGAGPRGLAAMPGICEFGVGLHARPLLDFDRQALHEYAVENELRWIDDDTNLNMRYDRNFLRKEVLPVLEERWPGIKETLSRVAVNQADTIQLMDDIAEMDMQNCHIEKYQSLKLTEIKNLTPVRQANLVRFYLQSLDLPVPDRKKIQHVLKDVIASRYDAVPCVSWEGGEIRRYGEHIIAMSPLSHHGTAQSIEWNLDKVCKLTEGELSAKLETGSGISASKVEKKVIIRFRRGGERIRPAGRTRQHELKKLFQEAGVPPWMRDRIPLLYVEDKLIAVAGFWIDESVSTDQNEKGWDISWSGKENIRLFK